MQLQQLQAEAVKLPPQERLALVSAIIESLHNVSVSESDRSAAIKRMRGLLTTNRPVPTDEEVSVMLEERLTEKYS
jgi:hypothetical protein